ncbi:serine hydrolase domain-containing protein [Flavobacterium zepuense]|nr:serine hydrolase domain-containing protein [Flavobacterium zepuense]
MKISLTVAFVLMSMASISQELPKIDALAAAEMSAKNIPAIGIAVIQDGKLTHLKTYGYSDLENRVKATVNTPFEVASISKTVVNLAIFNLVESGKIKLDNDINDYLPFKVKNPHLLKEKITVASLLNHHSGIVDNYAVLDADNNGTNGDSDIQLSAYLKSYFSPKGKLYSQENFQDNKGYKYCNVAYALLGVIIEKVSGTTLEDFSQNNIFKPLKMANTSWFLNGLNLETVAKTYTSDKNGKQVFLGFNGFPIYPSGQLRTSIKDYSNLILQYLNSNDSKFIFSSNLVDKITPEPGYSREGWYTWNKVAIGNTLYYAHEGANTGVKTVVLMDVISKNAVIIFINSEAKLGPLLMGIMDEL